MQRSAAARGPASCDRFQGMADGPARALGQTGALRLVPNPYAARLLSTADSWPHESGVQQ